MSELRGSGKPGRNVDAGIRVTMRNEIDRTRKPGSKSMSRIGLTHDLDKALFEQLDFKKKLFAGLRKISATSKLAADMGEK